jgi:hypothetical protein
MSSHETQRSAARQLLQAGQLVEAEKALREILARDPNDAESLTNLAAALGGLGRPQEAIVQLERALAVLPGSAEARANLGAALLHVGRTEEAIEQLRQAIAANADLTDAHVNFGMALLQKGDFAQGWTEHEWRLAGRSLALFGKPVVQPRWDGSRDLSGRTILIYAEQGLGDTIQFLRYVPLVAERGAKVILGCPGELRLLARTLDGGAVIHDGFSDIPPFELHCPLLSLPLAFGTRLETIPNKVPYLSANSNAAGLWAETVARKCTGLKVGLVWSGSSNFQFDASRSPGQLSVLSALAKVPGVTFVSLQKGPAAQQAKLPPAGMKLLDWTERLNDLADTAALIENLDLVISSDTAVAHLAGAMGKEVWVMLPAVADWRWMIGRTDSPWYPTMRLFRQQRSGDWTAVADQLAESLSRHIAR